MDDQVIIRWAIKKLMPEYECTVASNGKEALECIETSLPYDIVLMDLNMPVMNGFDTLKTIRGNDGYKNIPIVIVSTSRDKYDIERCKRLGALFYITKPDTLAELIDKLKYIFASRLML